MIEFGIAVKQNGYGLQAINNENENKLNELEKILSNS